MSTSPLAFGPFEFHPTTFRVVRNGVVVPLEPKAIDVLRLLLERAPGVVEKSEIFALVWKDVAVTDNALTRVIAQLRKALDDDAKNPRYIETVATRGYRMVADVQVVPTRDHAPVTTSSVPFARAAARTRWAALAGAVVCALVLAAVLRPIWSRATADGAPAAADGARTDHLQLALARPVQLTTGTGYDGMPAYSPDGTSLAFASDRTGTFEIYVQQLVPGAVPTPITSNGRQNVQPAWSPDGRFIAFHEAAGGGVWVVPSRGGTARRLVEAGSRPSWSPDGSAIAFQEVDATDVTASGAPTSASGIALVDPASGERRPLTRAGTPPGAHITPQWSADGRHVYFVEVAQPYLGARAESRSGVWRIGADGTGLVRVAGGTLLTPEYVPARDGSGAWIVTRTSSIWWQPFSVDMPDRPAVATGLTTPGVPAQLALTPDGRTLAWTTRNTVTSLWSAGLPGDAGRAAPGPLATGAGVRVTGAAAAPDGRLAYSGTVQGNTSQIWIRDERGAMRQVTTDDGDHFIPFWLADNREVAYFASHRGEDTFEVVDVVTGRERRLLRVADLPLPPSTAIHPLTSLNVVPDAALQRVIVTLVEGGVPNLWLFRLAGGAIEGGPTRLTSEPGGGAFPHWSPDGRSVSYQCGDGADIHACVVSADGTGRRQLTDERGQSFLGGWMGQDTILVAARRDAVWNVIAVHARTGAARPLTTFTDARSYVRYPHWDAAGRRILFERAETTGTIWKVQVDGDR